MDNYLDAGIPRRRRRHRRLIKQGGTWGQKRYIGIVRTAPVVKIA